jgi:hypothetical protein
VGKLVFKFENPAGFLVHPKSHALAGPRRTSVLNGVFPSLSAALSLYPYYRFILFFFTSFLP